MKSVQLHDLVYGEVLLSDPLVIDLYHSQAVQRLASIYQGGITAFIKTERTTTRLEHSVGVMALLQRLGAGVPEQAAGLIHDVPHTAFSHVIDFVFPNHEHTYHESHREAFIQTTDLPAIVSRYEVDWRWLSEAENFSLLERPLPTLCADRLDYFLRDGLSLGYLSRAAVDDVLAHLQAWDGMIVVTDIDVARRLGDAFIAEDKEIWCAVQEVGWYAVMARALRAALEGELLAKHELWSTDQAILERLRAAGHPEVQRWLALLRPEVTFTRVEQSPDMVVLPKVRTVDPPVLIEGQVRPLSQIDAGFAQRRQAYVESKQGEWGLAISDGRPRI